MAHAEEITSYVQLTWLGEVVAAEVVATICVYAMPLEQPRSETTLVE